MLLRKIIATGLLTASLLAACTAETDSQIPFPTYDPFLPLEGEAHEGQDQAEMGVEATTTPLPTATRPSTPTRIPLTVSPFPSGLDGQFLPTPTPDPSRLLPTPRVNADEYVVQSGDTLGVIAQRYGISVQALMQANNLSDPNLLSVGMVLKIPAAIPVSGSEYFKIIPDSELVYGPGAVYFDIGAFIQSQNGYLSRYTQDVNGVLMSGEEIVTMVAQSYSVNPRILLALLEYQSGWVTNPNPFNTSYPIGLSDESRQGLHRQLSWAANALNRGYYLWKVNAFSTWVLSDGQVINIDPTINAGTAAVQYFFSQLDNLEAWQKDTGGTGVFLTYYVFFGNPFIYAIEPLIPADLSQPELLLPFSRNERWYYTGGPHGGWDTGSAWASLDFAPPNGEGSCAASPRWVTAMADGLVVRTGDGAVIQDLDNDGYEQTGWVIFYMHVAELERVKQGEYLFAGERVGHPSCEGGFSNATHLHIARKYNGEWIAADGSIPFVLSGWVSSGTGVEYNGHLSRDDIRIEALDGPHDANLIGH
jgi:LasA protease